MYQINPISAFNDNYIWCIRELKSMNAIVVDPGDAEVVKAYLEKHQLNLTAILVTHHHFDHTGGIKKLTNHFNCEVYAPESKEFKGADYILKDSDSVTVLGLNFSVIAVPGHTLDHISYYQKEQAWLFSGDTLFAGGCGRIFEGDAPMMFKSLQKLSKLPKNTLVFCAHEYTMANLAFAKAADGDNPDLQERIIADQRKRDQNIPTVPSTIGVELATNPFLRADQQALNHTASQHSDVPLDNTLDVFASLREWKNNF